MAHNLARWTARIGLDEQLVTTKTLRRRFFSLVWYVGMRQTDPTWVEENRGPAWSSHPILIEPEQLPGPIAPASCKEGPTRKGRRSHRRYRWKENRDS